MFELLSSERSYLESLETLVNVCTRLSVPLSRSRLALFSPFTPPSKHTSLSHALHLLMPSLHTRIFFIVVNNVVLYKHATYTHQPTLLRCSSSPDTHNSSSRKTLTSSWRKLSPSPSSTATFWTRYRTRHAFLLTLPISTLTVTLLVHTHAN